MDHPEPISKRPMEIPQCRKGFTLEEAKLFIDQIMEIFHSLDDMSDLRSMFETGKQLSRAYFDCHPYRIELAQHLTNCDYPLYASKMMKKLNNMGVFKNDDIWFSSFYFYNTTWNFSDTLPEFATALATSGLPNLLNLNIGHQPYLENLSSKNVYYLIKASLSIIHNIARVPGNIHYFTSEAVRQALIHLAQREEEFLRCVSTLCLAHIIMEPELNMVSEASAGNIDLIRILFGYIGLARLSEKRRCHGFQILELLSALAAFSTHDPVKSNLITSPISGQTQENNITCLNFIKELIDNSVVPNPSPLSIREAEEATRILWNLCFDKSLSTGTTRTQLNTWLSDIVNGNHLSTSPQSNKPILRALEAINWQINTQLPRVTRSEFTECGPILFCYAPSNRIIVGRIAERLRDANLMLCNIPIGPEVLPPVESGLVGLSMCASNCTTLSQWIETIERASVLIVFMSDAFRLSPGCRYEVEYFLSTSSEAHPKPIIPVVLQPKFKPTGWLTSLITKHPIDFNGKRDPETSYDSLISQSRQAYADAKKKADLAADAAAAVAATASQSQTADGKRHMAIAGDTGVPGMSNSEVTMNHINASSITSSRGSIGLSPNIRRDDNHQSLNQILLPQPPSAVLNTSYNSRPLATGAWRHAIRPEVRNWSTSKVASWLKFRGLGHVPAQMAGGIDGILLSQLAGLRIWAPDYFTQSLRTELGLGFADSLRFLEALDELAPEDNDENNKFDENGLDGRSQIVQLDGTVPRN